jgi:TolB-like protein
MVDERRRKLRMKVSRLFFILLISAAPAFAFESTPTLAILDFENNSFFKPEEVQSLSKGLAQIMITELNGSGAIRVVERQKLRSLMDELKLSQSGMVSEQGSLQVGKLIGAKHLVFGGYMVMMDDKIRIDVRIVEVETGLTLKAGEVTGKTKDVLSLVQKLGNKILKDLNIKLAESGETPGRISIDALKLFSKGIEFEDKGDTARALECYRKALDQEPDFQQAKDRAARLSKRP